MSAVHATGAEATERAYAEAVARGTEQQLIPVYVWEFPVRLTHWTIATSILVLAVTGLYIGYPFVIVPGPAGQHFVMGTMKAIHFYAAIVFTVSVLLRVLWMFAGNHFARWHQFIPVHAERRRNLLPVLRFYTFFSTKLPPTTGHNPLAGAAYTAVFGLYLLMIATGLALYGASAAVDSPLRAFASLAPLLGGLQMARWIHHVAMWLLIGFAVHHVTSSFLTSLVEKDGEIDSIFSGYKFVKRDHLERELRETR